MRSSAYYLFLLNGIGEIIAAVLFVAFPDMFGFANELDASSKFLFM